MTALQIFTYLAVGAVIVALLAGLVNMLRGGAPNMSQKLMRARVILQAIAIIVVMAFLYFSTRSTPVG